MNLLKSIAAFIVGIITLLMVLGVLLSVGCVNIQDGFQEGHPLELPVYEKVSPNSTPNQPSGSISTARYWR